MSEMDENELRDLRHAMGTTAMRNMDALGNEEAVACLAEAARAMERAIDDLIERGVPRFDALGLIQHMAVLIALRSEAA